MEYKFCRYHFVTVGDEEDSRIISFCEGQYDVALVSYYGPVQMCVFGLEYEYISRKYKIKAECERGFKEFIFYR